MSLKDNYDQVTRFIHRLRRIVTDRSGKRIWADFKTIKRLNPGAALVLAAELYRWQKVYGITLIPRSIQRWTPVVRTQFKEMGLFSLLETRPIGKHVRGPSETTFVRFISGIGSEGKFAKDLRESLERVTGVSIADMGMYPALTEAMTNVQQHAYKYKEEITFKTLDGQWWISGSYNVDNSILTVMIFDQGIGIPASLPKEGRYERIKVKIPGAHTDATMITAALEYGRSATKEDHRGRGLTEIAKFAESNINGEIHIISGKGHYYKDRFGKEHKTDYSTALGGTFIQWELPLGDASGVTP